MGRNEDVNIADVAPGLQTIHLKEEETHRLVLHPVHLCKPHGYNFELYAVGKALRKLSIHEVEDEPAATVAEGRSRWADRGRYIVLEGITMYKLATLT